MIRASNNLNQKIYSKNEILIPQLNEYTAKFRLLSLIKK